MSWMLGHVSGNFGASSLSTAFSVLQVPTQACRMEGWEAASFSVAGSHVLAGCLLFCGRVCMCFKKCPVGEAGSIRAEELQLGWKGLGAGRQSLCMASAAVTQLLTASPAVLAACLSPPRGSAILSFPEAIGLITIFHTHETPHATSASPPPALH